MCLCLKGPVLKPERAKKDITVYKILCRQHWLDDVLRSPHQGFEYKPGRLYKLSKRKWEQSKRQAKEEGRGIDYGFHAFRSRKAALEAGYFGSNIVLFRCVIPAGAEYYTGLFNEIVSNQIIAEKESKRRK